MAHRHHLTEPDLRLLDGLRQLTVQRNQFRAHLTHIETDIRTRALEAHAAGIPWGAIGTALGLPPGTAWNQATKHRTGRHTAPTTATGAPQRDETAPGGIPGTLNPADGRTTEHAA